ncbi:unnamed protein product [Ophioblennius macclurei]
MSALTEQPFYDDSFLSAFGHHPGASLPDYKLLKQNMNLNFSESYRSSNFKPQPHGDFYPAEPGSLKLASPELERLIIQNSNGLITTTPTPGQYLYSRPITEEQEGFAEGFVKALDDLHKMNQMAPPNVSIGCAPPAAAAAAAAAAASVFGASVAPEPLEYTTLSSCTNNAAAFPSGTISYLPHHHHHHHQHHQQHQQQYQQQQQQQQQQNHHHQHHPGQHAPHAALPFQHAMHAPRFGGLKEEPQTVPDMQSSDAGSSPPMSPIDLENQERIKAERKRLRNRLAASKCRRRKLERIARLEDKVKGLKSDNAGLSSTASVLREQVAQLKQKVMTHVSSGCQLTLLPKVKSY